MNIIIYNQYMMKGSVDLPLFTGAATALITPFKNGKADYVSMGKLIEWQISQGIDALVICGTTGEASTLSSSEKVQLVKFAVDLTDKRVPVIAGAGTNSTNTTVELAKEMENVGAPKNRSKHIAAHRQNPLRPS